MGHVTSPDQGLSSKRGKSLGTRLKLDEPPGRVQFGKFPNRERERGKERGKVY
jgi:hypothetical protein